VLDYGQQPLTIEATPNLDTTKCPARFAAYGWDVSRPDQRSGQRWPCLQPRARIQDRPKLIVVDSTSLRLPTARIPRKPTANRSAKKK